jgi:hypothetical protein
MTSANTAHLPVVNGQRIAHRDKVDPHALIDGLSPGDVLFIPDRWFVETARHAVQDVMTHAAMTCSVQYDSMQYGHTLTRLPVPLDVVAQRALSPE